MKYLLALLLLTGMCFANSIDYDTGNFSSGTMSGAFKQGSMLSVSITGSLHTINLTTGPLVLAMNGCPTGSTCFDFSSGSTTVSQNGSTVFTDQLVGGITIKSNGTASINASLMSEPGVAAGSATVSFDFNGMKITAGSENVAFNSSITPEPAALFLFGTGLLGTVYLWRKKPRA